MQFDKIISFFLILYENVLKKKKGNIKLYMLRDYCYSYL